MKKLLILLVILTTQAFAETNVEKFFTRAQGHWTHVNSQISGSDGLGKFTQFSLTIAREARGWSVYEESCLVMASSEEEECGETWSIYTLSGGNLVLVTTEGKIPLEIIASLPTKLNYRYSQGTQKHLYKFSFNSAGNMVIETHMALINRAIVLRKQ